MTKIKVKRMLIGDRVGNPIRLYTFLQRNLTLSTYMEESGERNTTETLWQNYKMKRIKESGCFLIRAVLYFTCANATQTLLHMTPRRRLKGI